jgi:hypothetical protein
MDAETSTGSVFYSRCRPQNADLIDIVLRERRMFIGWPLWRPDVEPQRGRLREAIVDRRCSDEEWSALYPHLPENRAMHSRCRNFVWDIKVGDIGLVQRFHGTTRITRPYRSCRSIYG